MSEDMNEHTPRWTPDTVEALLKEYGDYSVMYAVKQLASALTWALERIGELEGELNHFRDPLMQPSQRYWESRWRDAEAERDAANARAERARVDALDEAEERLRSFAAKKREDWSRDKDVSKVVGSAITQTVDLCADLVNPRALKGASK